MKSARVLGVLLTCVALTTSGALRAQAHPEAPEPPDIRMLVLPEDRPSYEELRGANPCYRDRYMEGVAWQRMAWLSFCVQRARSSAVSQAWVQGLDAYGEALQFDAPDRKLAEMEFWLRRLTGKYRIEGKYWNSGGNSPISGSADCFGIGSGPGVSCVISTEWKAPKESNKDKNTDMALYSAMQGLVLLFGIDPVASQVRVTLVDFRGVRMRGFLDDGVVMFGGRPDFGLIYSWTTSLVATKPGGDLAMKFLLTSGTTRNLILFDLQLHREISLTNQEPDAASVLEALPLVQIFPESLDPDPEMDLGEEESNVDLVDVEMLDAAVAGTPNLETNPGALPRDQQQGKRPPAIDALDEVSALSELERQRRVLSRSPPSKADVVTVTRRGETRVRLQPYGSRDTIRFRRESAARQASDGMGSTMQLRRDHLTSNDGRKIRDVTLDLAANIDEPDGLPALVPFGRRTSLVNIDHVRLDNSDPSTITKLTNVINPQTRRCTALLGLADNGDDFPNRFVLLGDRLRDCEDAVRARQGDLFFADDVPQRLRQDLSEIYDPIYTRFARLLGSEPGMVFVAWRAEAPRSDLRFERNWSRSVLLQFNGSAWQQGIAPLQRKSLEDNFAAEQIARRIGWQDERKSFTQSAMNYLLMLNSMHNERATVSRLTSELPDWIAKCSRDLNNGVALLRSTGDVASYNCGLVLQFVYDAVVRAKSKGNDTIYTTWRGLLAASYERGRSGVDPEAFIAASEDSRRIARGLMSSSMDWSKFVEELDKFGVRLKVKPGQPASVVEVVSLVNFRD